MLWFLSIWVFYFWNIGLHGGPLSMLIGLLSFFLFFSFKIFVYSIMVVFTFYIYFLNKLATSYSFFFLIKYM
jgi:hypothetical protein